MYCTDFCIVFFFEHKKQQINKDNKVDVLTLTQNVNIDVNSGSQIVIYPKKIFKKQLNEMYVCVCV